MSFLRQLGRRYIPFTKDVSGTDEKNLFFSLELTKILARARHWNWTSVLTKAIYWGMAFFALSVILARVLNVFFSYLNEMFVANNMSLLEVSLAFYAAGSLAFQFRKFGGVGGQTNKGRQRPPRGCPSTTPRG